MDQDQGSRRKEEMERDRRGKVDGKHREGRERGRERQGGIQSHRRAGRGHRQEEKNEEATGARARVGVCAVAPGAPRLLQREREGCCAGESLGFLLNVINYSVALNKSRLFAGKPDRVSFNLMFAEPTLLSHLPDVEHMLGSE